MEQEKITLISGGADKLLIKHVLNKSLQDLEPFELSRKEQFQNRIFSIDSAGGLVLTGHDKNLTLSDATTFERKWQKRPDPARKVAPDHLKVLMDEQGQIAVTSSTDKQLMLFETESGRLLCKA